MTVDWHLLVETGAVVVAAVSAVAASVAARASRDALRDQQRSGRVWQLQDLHESLSRLQTVEMRHKDLAAMALFIYQVSDKAKKAAPKLDTTRSGRAGSATPASP